MIKKILIIFIITLSACSEENNIEKDDDGLVRVTFATDWKAQAEQGGFYQALASGLYEEKGLNVEIIQGLTFTFNNTKYQIKVFPEVKRSLT